MSEKLKSQQLKDSFDALGLAIDNVSDPDKVLDRCVLKYIRIFSYISHECRVPIVTKSTFSTEVEKKKKKARNLVLITN